MVFEIKYKAKKLVFKYLLKKDLDTQINLKKVLFVKTKFHEFFDIH